MYVRCGIDVTTNSTLGGGLEVRITPGFVRRKLRQFSMSECQDGVKYQPFLIAWSTVGQSNSGTRNPATEPPAERRFFISAQRTRYEVGWLSPCWSYYLL